MNTLTIPRHFIVKNGQLLPHHHINSIQNYNFRNIPYVHNVRLLNFNYNQQQIQHLTNQIQQLENQIITIISNNNAQKYALDIENQKLKNIIIQKNQQIIQLNKQIQRLSKLQQIHQIQSQKSKLSTSMIINNFFNQHQNLSSSKLSLDCSNASFQNQNDSRVTQQLLKRVQNSENILDQMLKMIKKPTHKIINQKQINNQNNEFHRTKILKNQQSQQNLIMNSKQQLLQKSASCQFDKVKINYQQFECQSQLNQSYMYEGRFDDSKTLQYQKQNSLEQRFYDVNEFERDSSLKKSNKKCNSRLETQISSNNE